MVPIREYYLSVNKDDLLEIQEAIDKLHGYITAKVQQKYDPEHGPVDPEAELMNKVSSPIAKLQSSLSRTSQPVQDLNKVMDQTRKEMANDIISVIQNGNNVDVLLKLIQTLEKYEIIGKKSFARNENDDILPF